MLSTASRTAPVLERRLQALVPDGAIVRAARIRDAGACVFGRPLQREDRSVRAREFAVGRRLAADALRAANATSITVPSGPRGMPLWPAGYTGSITHADGYCLAAVAPAQCIGSLGIDLERLDDVGADLADLICSPREQRQPGVPLGSFFAAKEAVFKCQYPLARQEAEFTDARIVFSLCGAFSVEVDDSRLHLAGRCVGRVTTVGPYVLAAAWLD